MSISLNMYSSRLSSVLESYSRLELVLKSSIVSPRLDPYSSLGLDSYSRRSISGIQGITRQMLLVNTEELDITVEEHNVSLC